jgi:DNA-binding response OmpR family regulator
MREIHISSKRAKPDQFSDDPYARPKLRTVYAKTPLTKTDRAYLLEDNEANGVVAEEYLKVYGFTEVVWRRSLEAAEPDLPALADGEFDIILLDVMLPDGTSVDFLRRIKDAGCPCPVGFYTAKSSLEDASFYDAHGCDFVFAKPLLVDDFFMTLNALKAG